MDPVLNPYSPGAGNTPRALVGRDADLEAFDIAIRRISLGRHDRSVIVTGLRGVGKTVLLREYGHIAAREGWIHEHVEVGEGTDFVRIVAEMVRRAILRLSMTKRLASHASKAAGALKAFQVRWGHRGLCYSPRHGVIAFTVPMFDQYLRRRSES
ncbi:MAG: ATP-binding protein [Acidimicrobiaceae bacterium]|nr:ATP-binding protein [Acidimicrobiaceae bacterium]